LAFRARKAASERQYQAGGNDQATYGHADQQRQDQYDAERGRHAAHAEIDRNGLAVKRTYDRTYRKASERN
jgi:hypothetical protein